MIDAPSLLADLQRQLKTLTKDLEARLVGLPEVEGELRAEHDEATTGGRTARSYVEWRAERVNQVAAAWILSIVFVRFLEDNQLIDPPVVAGPGERRQRAGEEYELYIREFPDRTIREYLWRTFDRLAQLPATSGLFGVGVLLRVHANWPSADALQALVRFFQATRPDGSLVHEFTDSGWNTRFLGNLYQDLSELAREQYALLQTPEFFESFILDRTMEPALAEFRLQDFKLIDPACGSGHFLLGAFARLFERWRARGEPGRVAAQKALDSVHGVDLNPFAVAITRFRLLVAALRACGVSRLADSPGFAVHVACGDALLHGRAVDRQGFLEPVQHHYVYEDGLALSQLLRGRQYHAVVANPPYITPKDKRAAIQYRTRFKTCHRQYSLAVPFMELVFELAVDSGFTGQITANSFMKREFGKKLIEEFLASQVELTHVIDTSGVAGVPGHGTPTVILLGRNRRPTTDVVRALIGMRGSVDVKEPERGPVWTSILHLADQLGETDYVSAADLPRQRFARHPWTLIGGGASEVKQTLETSAIRTLGGWVRSVGRGAHTGADDVYIFPSRRCLLRARIASAYVMPLTQGESLRDWTSGQSPAVLFPYVPGSMAVLAQGSVPSLFRQLWAFRTELWERREPNGNHREIGKTWFEFSRFHPERIPGVGVAFAFVSTHNHFVFDRGGKVFKQSAPVIKLPANATEQDHLGLLGLLNSSTGCFWMKQVFHTKGAQGVGEGVKSEMWERFFEFDATKIRQFPIPAETPEELAEQLNSLACDRTATLPAAVLERWNSGTTPLADAVAHAATRSTAIWQQMIAAQEELDWTCYRLYGLIDEDLTHAAPPAIALGQRAFEIALARKVASGGTETEWFDRHRSTPITEMPEAWPADYRELIGRRIAAIESEASIGLIEQPEFKRRWNVKPWADQVHAALRDDLLNRLERLFDFDGRMNDAGRPTARIDIELISMTRLADLAAEDPALCEVTSAYLARADVDLPVLVGELVAADSVPLLPALRLKDSGLAKRQAWERTWALQRSEDTLDARGALPADDPRHLGSVGLEESKTQQGLDRIPVPPRYTSSDFRSTTYWQLRGKLDVPRERWVSFPHCEGPDGTLVVAWAGYDHLQLARAVSAYYMRIKEQEGGAEDPRLVPLVASLIELQPWLLQWHNDLDPAFGVRMGEYFGGFIDDELRALGQTREAVRDWRPSGSGRKPSTRGARTR